MSQEVNPGEHSGLTWEVSHESGNGPESLSLRGAGTTNTAHTYLVLSIRQTLVSQSFPCIKHLVFTTAL